MEISASGFVSYIGNSFEGDCETTNDMPGPYYRPDAPVRTDVHIKTANKEEKIEFYRTDNLLWIKSDSRITGGYPLRYNGNNTY